MFELRAKSSKETDILMYGSISEWGRVRAEDVYKAIASAKSQGYEKVNLKINSPGGSIFEGIAIMSQMGGEDIIIEACVEGMAASMASVVLQGAHKRKMVKGGRLMVHQGHGGAFGSATQIRDYADLLESLNKTMADIYAKRSKRDTKYILENWMAEGKDTWFTAEQALKEGLIDEIVDGKVVPLEKENASYMEMAAHYSQQLNTTETEMNKQELIALLGLKADATEAEIQTALKAMKAKADANTAPPAPKPDASNAAPAGELPKGDEKAKLVEAVMELAKARGMKEEGQLAAIKKVAEFDIKAAMDLLPPVAAEIKPTPAPSVNDILTALKGGSSSVAEDRKSWSYDDWQAKDSAGLLKLAKENVAEFSKLFEAQYGIKPTEEEVKKLVA